MVPLTVRKIEVKDFNEPTADIVQFGLPQYTQEELRQAQANDVDLGVIIKVVLQCRGLLRLIR